MTEDGHGGYIVSGNFDVDRVADLFAGFHPEEDIESTTVGGLVSEWLGRVPKAGEFVERDGVRIDVLASRRAARGEGADRQIPGGGAMNEGDAVNGWRGERGLQM